METTATGIENIRYKSREPSGPLSDFVHCFWQIENLGATKHRVRILPDGYFDVLFTSIDRGPLKKSIIGLATKARSYGIGPGAFAFGISFKLPAAEYIFKMPISDLLNQGRYLPQDFWKISEHRIKDLDEFVDQVNPFIINSLASISIQTEKMNFFSKLYRSQGAVAVNGLCESSSWHIRDINRYFNKYFGLTLKMYCDILRFRASFEPLAREMATNSDGYFDQSHYIRQVRKFTGNSPKQLLAKGKKCIQLSTINSSFDN